MTTLSQIRVRCQHYCMIHIWQISSNKTTGKENHKKATKLNSKVEVRVRVEARVKAKAKIKLEAKVKNRKRCKIKINLLAWAMIRL